jgi:hypothetical protein
VPIAGAQVALFSVEQLVNGWKHGFAGPEDSDDTREAVLAVEGVENESSADKDASVVGVAP